MNLYYCNTISNFILNIAHEISNTSTNMKEELLEPLELFLINYKETNNNLAKNSYKILNDIDL